MEDRACTNCGRHIGNLEVRAEWRGNVVCGECVSRLQSDADRRTFAEMESDRLLDGGKRWPPAAVVCGAVAVLSLLLAFASFVGRSDDNQNWRTEMAVAATVGVVFAAAASIIFRQANKN